MHQNQTILTLPTQRLQSCLILLLKVKELQPTLKFDQELATLLCCSVQP